MLDEKAFFITINQVARECSFVCVNGVNDFMQITLLP